MEWLQDLEKKVVEVGAEIAGLRKKNRELNAKIKRLERKAKQQNDGSDTWATEREQLRKRVSGLVTTLDSLLDDDES